MDDPMEEDKEREASRGPCFGPKKIAHSCSKERERKMSTIGGNSHPVDGGERLRSRGMERKLSGSGKKSTTIKLESRTHAFSEEKRRPYKGRWARKAETSLETYAE